MNHLNMIETCYTSDITLFLRICVSFHSSFTTMLKYSIPKEKEIRCKSIFQVYLYLDFCMNNLYSKCFAYEFDYGKTTGPYK